MAEFEPLVMTTPPLLVVHYWTRKTRVPRARFFLKQVSLLCTWRGLSSDHNSRGSSRPTVTRRLFALLPMLLLKIENSISFNPLHVLPSRGATESSLVARVMRATRNEINITERSASQKSRSARSEILKQNTRTRFASRLKLRHPGHRLGDRKRGRFLSNHPI